MTDKFISNRLTDSKASSEIWTALAETIEEFWAFYVFPEIERLKKSRKTFLADDESLSLIIKELGAIFEVPVTIDAHEKHLSILRRRTELHGKRTRFLLESLIERNFGGMPVKWEPLYCRKDGNYATDELAQESEIPEENKDEYYLTSRGMIWADLDEAKLGGRESQLSLTDVARQARDIVPEHIVIDPSRIKKHYDITTKQIAGLRRPIGLVSATNRLSIDRVEVRVTAPLIKQVASVRRPIGIIAATNRHVFDVAEAKMKSSTFLLTHRPIGIISAQSI